MSFLTGSSCRTMPGFSTMTPCFSRISASIPHPIPSEQGTFRAGTDFDKGVPEDRLPIVFFLKDTSRICDGEGGSLEIENTGMVGKLQGDRSILLGLEIDDPPIELRSEGIGCGIDADILEKQGVIVEKPGMVRHDDPVISFEIFPFRIRSSGTISTTTSWTVGKRV